MSDTAGAADRRAQIDALVAAHIAALPDVAERPSAPHADEILLGRRDRAGDREMAYEADGSHSVRNVSAPSLRPYLPDPARATGAAVIVVPGGGFYYLSIEKEGHNVAEWLRERGIAAFVLKYRVRESGDTHAQYQELLVRGLVESAFAGGAAVGIANLDASSRAAVVDDVNASIALVRRRASEWNVDARRVGTIGFSAGAYATTMALIDGRERVDAVACIYGGSITAAQLPDAVPPLFAATAARDELCAEDLLGVVNAWRARGGSVEAHLYDSDVHGFGIQATGGTTDAWPARYEEWLTRTGFMD
jgi:acetyl esterase/lipase